MLRITVLSLFSFLHIISFSQNVIGRTEALLIREAKIISDKFGDRIWPGISKTPFTIVLVTDSVEYLIYHPYPSNDFTLAGKDSILQADVYKRKRTYATGLLATFPAVSGVNCIVVGTPENTGRSLTDWMITLLHEHFHQYVNSQPGYFDDVNKLNLSGGDETGMWMLNYPFPYDSLVIVTQFEKYKKALSDAVAAPGKKNNSAALQRFIGEKEKFKSLLKPDDYKYFSFQLWLEGLARYTEYKFLELLKSYKISAEIAGIKGFTPLKLFTQQFYNNELQSLKVMKLETEKRICIYPVGFAEGLLLDAVNKQWRQKYFTDKFATEKYYTQ